MADNYELENDISLDAQLDDIPDLPGYITPLSGAYHTRWTKGIELKEINGDNYFSVEREIVTLGELSEKPAEGEVVPKPGDLYSSLFKRNHALAMGNFKALIKPIAERFNCKTVAEVIEISKGLEFIEVLKRTYNKDKDQHNFNLKKIDLV